MSERRERRADRRGGSGQALVDDVLWYGVWQVVLLSLPLVWLIYQTPETVVARNGAITALVCMPLAVGCLRHGVVSPARPWPYVEDMTLGTDEGFAAYLTRAVTLWGGLGVAVYGGMAAELLTGSPAANVAVAALASVAGAALIPRLATADRERFGLAVVSLVLTGTFADPFDPTTGDPAALFPYAVLVVGVLVDVRPVLAHVRDGDRD